MDSNHGQESKENANQKSNALCRVDRRLGNDGNGGRSNKMNKLLEALDDFLISEPDDFGLSFGASDQDILSQCKALRKTLRKQRNSLSPRSTLPTIDTTAPRTNHNAHEEQDLPYVPPPLSLTPWTSGSVPKTLPALPEIKSLTLETATFTHSGVTSNAGAFSYERLEWLGDAYLYLVSTILISSTFTSHLPGKCAQIRELLVKNETLASYARHYGFEKRARLPSEFSSDNLKGYRAKEVEKVKVMGDIFEAYVAAVILSDPEQGVDRVSAWLKSLWAQTISKQIKDQERLNEKTKAIPVDNVNANLNPKDMLSRKIGAKGVKITYRDIGPEKKDPVTGFPLFTVGVYLDGWGEHDKQLGVGKALGKKDAGMKAADMALANKKLMAKYGEMKRVHDEKLQAEKERQAAEGDHSSQATGAGCHL
jgi:ribonuclease III